MPRIHQDNKSIFKTKAKTAPTLFLILPIIGFLLICASKETLGQTKWRLSAETGFYQRSLFDSQRSLYFLSRLNGSVRFRGQSPSNFWWLSLQLKPEFYQDIVGYTSLKFLTKGQYLYQKSGLSMGMGLDIRRYLYINTPREISLDLFELSGIFSCSLSEHYRLLFYPAYYYQDISNSPRQKLDALKAKLYLSRVHSNHLYMGTGIYLEKFSVESNSIAFLLENQNDNNGYRFGPEFYFESNKIIYLTIRYSFLWHWSKITRDPSFEQYFRILLGKVFRKNFTLLCVVDYYWNNLKLQQDSDILALYIPFDTENRVDIKIERPFTNKVLYFVRGGYFKDDFALQNFTAQGWQFLIGLELNY